MYEWHGKKYWGAAHGLTGIMHVLMDMELRPDEIEDVKSTLRYMIKNRFRSGNYRSSQESESDRLVHWCHGAPGVALTLVKAAEVIIFMASLLPPLLLLLLLSSLAWKGLKGKLRNIDIKKGKNCVSYAFQFYLGEFWALKVYIGPEGFKG